MIQPPADFVALFQQVLAWLLASTFLPLVSILGAGVGVLFLSWVFQPYGQLNEWLKRNIGLGKQ
jgi:hypothetical protein